MKKDFKNSKAMTFMKKYAYYIVMVACIIAIATMVTLSVVLNQPVKTPIGGGDVVVDKPTGNEPGGDVPGGDVPGGNPDPNPGEDVDTPSVMVFQLPMKDAKMIRRYSDKEAIYNPTLNAYATHQAIDYQAAANVKVVAVYDGVVESVGTDAETSSIVVIILHQDNIRSIYSSIDNVTVKAGDKIAKGTAFADPSTTMSTEKKDGAHLHFQMSVNGELTDPNTFFADGDK